MREREPACEALPGRAACRLRGTGRVAPRIRVQPPCLRVPGAPVQLIGLISGVITGVTAGAMGLCGAAGIAGFARFAAFLLGFFAALRAGFLLAAFLVDLFFEAFFFATRFFEERFFDDRFFDERFFDDFFLAFLVDFFLEDFFFAAMLAPFNVDRLSVVRGARRAPFALPSVRIRIERDW